MNRAEKERSIFMEVFNDTISNKDRYIIDPEKSFTRNRALTLENTAEAIYTMSGSSLNKERASILKVRPSAQPPPPSFSSEQR